MVPPPDGPQTFCQDGSTVTVTVNDEVSYLTWRALDAAANGPFHTIWYSGAYPLWLSFGLGAWAVTPIGGPNVAVSVVYHGACGGPVPQGPDRYIYCAAAGNTDANGNPLGVGQTLNLKWGEPAGDKHYTGATLGFWVQGVGLTCQLTPAQAALAAASTVKVNHTGAPNSQEGDPVYTFVPA
jgi:hypothetical protein